MDGGRKGGEDRGKSDERTVGGRKGRVDGGREERKRGRREGGRVERTEGGREKRTSGGRTGGEDVGRERKYYMSVRYHQNGPTRWPEANDGAPWQSDYLWLVPDARSKHVLLSAGIFKIS